jgi:hypothetical protein
MAVRSTLLLLLILAACGPGEIQPDGGGDDDVDGGMGGLEFRWTATGLGESIEGAVIDEVRLYLRDIRAVGDAAGDLTYEGMRELQLDGEAVPVIAFREAPPGRYSAFEFRLAGSIGDDEAWEMRGTVTVDETYELEIDDDVSSSVSLPLDLDLAPGTTEVLVVDLDLAAVLEPVDWGAIEPDEGERITIDDDSPELPGLRSRLVAAFSIGAPAGLAHAAPPGRR